MYKRFRSHGPRHSTDHHLAAVRLLDRLQILIMHTCVHREQPIYSMDMVEHIIGEVDKMRDSIKEITEELCHLSGHHEVYMEAKKALCDLKGIFNYLREQLRKVIQEPNNPVTGAVTATNHNMHTHFERVRGVLSEACPRIRREYDELVNDMHRLGLISSEIKSTHVL